MIFFNPSPQKLLFLRCLLYMANIVPRNTTGHGRGGEIAAQSVPLAAFFQPLRPSGHLPYILLCKTQRRSTLCIEI